MHSFTILTTLLSLFTSSFALLSSDVFESLPAVPQGWRRVGEPSPNQRIHLRIAMYQPGHERFDQKLMAISTPNHPEYGQHLSREEVKEILKPRDEATEAVLTWLQTSGISNSDIQDKGEWINFWAPVSKAEQMLKTEFHVYGSSVSQSEMIRTLHYSVPRNVSSHITMIQPTTRFGQPRAQRRSTFEIQDGPLADGIAKVPDVPSRALNVTNCNSTITPDCLKALYNISNYEAVPSQNSLLGVCGYLNQTAKFYSLQNFYTAYAPYAKGSNFSYEIINGGTFQQGDDEDDGEANLDIQYATSVGYNTPAAYYSTGGLGELDPDIIEPTPDSNNNEPYLDFLTYILALPDNKLPQTLSTSYGEDEQSIPAAYAINVCNMFGQLGARGVSVIFSSGDEGVGQGCEANDGTNSTRFQPVFPAACPYVTSVGATQHVQPERAASFSSGGFSNRWPRPSYQNSAVSAYLNILGDQWTGLYNVSGRGFPDVSAQGVNYHVIDFGRDVLISGTSASAPTFAGIISLLNNARLSIGQAPLGFLNPWLYSTAQAGGGFTDIVDGGSTGCHPNDAYHGGPSPVVPYASWNATTGWDPVTGLGTPDFGRLLDLSSPTAKFTTISRNLSISAAVSGRNLGREVVAAE